MWRSVDRFGCLNGLGLACFVLAIAEGSWTAKGTMRLLWATPLLEYENFFNAEQLDISKCRSAL